MNNVWWTNTNLNPLYLRLAKSGQTYTASYSSDGTAWIEVPNQATLNVVGPLLVGLSICDIYHNDPFYADFDYFRIYPTVVNYVPETPLGTIAASIAMIASLFAVKAKPWRRAKQIP